MKPFNRGWKIFVIHHSHTDVGYTDRQEKIEQYHVDYIRQAIQIAEDARSGRRPEWTGFKWTCEAFWAVERFLEQADESEKHRLAAALQRGDLELSGSYLNMTELNDYATIRRQLSAAGEYGRSVGVPVTAAITADINGYSWGYSQALLEAGIDSLLSCVHSYHGMFPIGRKQTPFYWEAPNGGKVLVWNGEHYMLGNELGLLPRSVFSYTIKDEMSGLESGKDFFHHAIAPNHWEFAETRIERYLSQLEEEGYPYDFVLVNISGRLHDNAPPNGEVAAFLQEWNQKYGEAVQIELTTLQQFFNHVRSQSIEIPVYRGDWPDWWSDGVASMPLHTQIFRDAQRTYALVQRLNADSGQIPESVLREVEYQLTMYGEHTFGYHSSISEPWHPLVQSLIVRKQGYAAQASNLVYRALDKLLEKEGQSTHSAVMPYRFEVFNPYDVPHKDQVQFILERFEISEFPDGVEVTNATTGEVVTHQLEMVNKGIQVSTWVHLNPKESRIFSVRPAPLRARGITTTRTRLSGSEGVHHDLLDMYPRTIDTRKPIRFTENGVDTPHVSIQWVIGEGIVAWTDSLTGRSLIRGKAPHPAFTPVYEVTKVSSEKEMSSVRLRMGRNRKGPNVARDVGRLTEARLLADGELYAIVELKYEVAGMRHYSLHLKLYRDEPRVDVTVRIHKESVWDPENVYVSLPFYTNQPGDQVWLDKAGALVRPGVDQLPGTCLDYYVIQEGIAFMSDEFGIAIGIPDTPLIQTGPLSYETRFLNGQQGEDWEHPLYSWVMNNFWDTNFHASLGGFYEFRYHVCWSNQWSTPNQAIQTIHRMNAGLPVFRTKN